VYTNMFVPRRTLCASPGGVSGSSCAAYPTLLAYAHALQGYLYKKLAAGRERSASVTLSASCPPCGAVIARAHPRHNRVHEHSGLWELLCQHPIYGKPIQLSCPPSVFKPSSCRARAGSSSTGACRTYTLSRRRCTVSRQSVRGSVSRPPHMLMSHHRRAPPVKLQSCPPYSQMLGLASTNAFTKPIVFTAIAMSAPDVQASTRAAHQ